MACQVSVTVAVLWVAVLAACAEDGIPTADILPSEESRAARSYRFSADDERLLDEIEHACFAYFWKEVGTPAPLVRDRKKAPVSSIAAVGFQLSSLPIGVERGWISRAAGEERARAVQKSLLDRTDNKKFGVYLHYPDLNTGGLSKEGFEIVASTVDHALLMAGAMTAASYFGGDVKALAGRLIAETNWKAYAVDPNGFLSMGWRPATPENIEGPGKFLEWSWRDSSDEERLIYFLAAGAPRAAHALPPEQYYRLKRVAKQHQDMPPYVVSWPGALFTYFFSHCWIDYRALGADDPRRCDITAPRVDWHENSRRAVLTHRARCLEQKDCGALLAEGWGLSACVGRDGYIVPQVRPNLSDQDEWFDCTIAPYAAGSAIMFAPQESMAALRAFRALRDDAGAPLVWRDPNDGGYGFVDAFSLKQKYVCDDYVGIDQGPMLLAIENARTGLVWKLFMAHEVAQRAVERLRLNAP